MPAVIQAGGVNCRNAFVSFKDRKSVELAKARGMSLGRDLVVIPWGPKGSKGFERCGG